MCWKLGQKKETSHSHIADGMKVLAAQTLKIASINGLGHLDKLETELEDEINYENRSPAKTRIGRLRRQGQHKLHSKVILLIVVLLNIIDCILVMAELILDFNHVSHLLTAKKDLLTSFSTNMVAKYKSELEPSYDDDSYYQLLQPILDANIVFPNSGAANNLTLFTSECAQLLNKTAADLSQSLSSYINTSHLLESDWSEPSQCFQPFVTSNESSWSNVTRAGQSYVLSSRGQIDDRFIIIAHKLHYASVAILSVLVLFCFLKLLCSGKRFFKSRMQVFDSIIVIISFILDLVFIEGITSFQLDDFTVVLSILLPWRIIRVVNSLIVAVLDKQRLNLKIIYTQKKKISRTLTETTTKMEVMQRHIEVLQSLCSSRGVGDGDVRKALGKKNSVASQKNGSSGGLSMALGKLAFQAADAFAPITNNHKKINKVNGSEPILSGERTPQLKGDNNNANTNDKNNPQGVKGHKQLGKCESSPQVLSSSASEDNLESVTIHIHGQSEEEEGGEGRKKARASVSLPDLTEDSHVISDDDVVSRL